MEDFIFLLKSGSTCTLSDHCFFSCTLRVAGFISGKGITSRELSCASFPSFVTMELGRVHFLVVCVFFMLELCIVLWLCLRRTDKQTNVEWWPLLLPAGILRGDSWQGKGTFPRPQDETLTEVWYEKVPLHPRHIDKAQHPRTPTTLNCRAGPWSHPRAQHSLI